MRMLNTTVSAVNAYANKLGGSYMTLAGESDNVQEEVAQMRQRVQQAQEDATYQREQAGQLKEEASGKVNYYAALLNSAQAEASAAQAEIDYVLSNPIPVTHEDSEGNTYTTYEIDQAALAAAQSRFDRAMAEVRYYQGKVIEAREVEAEATYAYGKLDNLQRGIAAVNGVIQEQQFRISQNDRELRAEAGYNLQSMRHVLERLEEYLGCKGIYMSERLQ